MVVIMERNQLFRYLKLIVITALIIGLIGAVFFLIFGFSLIWQAMAATLITIFLALLTILFIFVSIYLWIMNVMLKRELKREKEEIERISHNLKNCNKKLREKKALDK
jgi:membrane protein implicated in regulation of membrane protease activity